MDGHGLKHHGIAEKVKEKTAAVPGCDTAEDAADNSDNEAFGQILAQQTPLRRAHGRAHGELALAGGDARHHQAANVHATQEEHDTHEALHQVQRFRIRAANVRRHSAARRACNEVRLFHERNMLIFGGNKACEQILLDRSQFGVGLLQRSARVESTDHGNAKRRVRPFQQILLFGKNGFDLHRHVHLGLIAGPNTVEVGWRYADNGYRHVGYFDLPAHNVGVATEEFVPKTVAQYYRPATLRPAAHIVIYGDQAPAIRLYTKQIKG